MARGAHAEGKHNQASDDNTAFIPQTIDDNTEPLNGGVDDTAVIDSGIDNTAVFDGNIDDTVVFDGGVDNAATFNGGNTNFATEPQKKKHRTWLIVLIIIVAVVVLIAVAYFVGVNIFSSRLLPNTTIAGRDVSLDTTEEAEAVLDDIIGDYNFTVNGEGFEMNITSEQAGLQLNSQAIAQKMMDDVDPWRWPFEIFNSHDESKWFVASYGESTGLSDLVTAAVNEFNETAQMPVDATYTYDEDQARFVVVPEVYGTAINAEKVVDTILASTTELQSTVSLDDDVLYKPSVLSDNAELISVVDDANAMIQVNIQIELASVWIDEITPGLIVSWVIINDDNTVTLDEDAIYRWAYEVAGRCDTIGKTRSFTTPYGESVTVSGGTYGWMTSSRSLTDLIVDAIYAHESTTLEIPTTSRGAIVSLDGGKDWGNRYIDVNLSSQYVRFYDSSGDLIWESSCVTGLPNGERDTPTGVFYIYNKERDTYLEDEEKTYRSHVDYWMPFYRGDGLHDADWRSSFGDSIYTYDGSHGCVNLPSSAAASLYSLCSIGDCVVVHW